MILSAQIKRPYHLLKGVLANVVYGFPSKALRVIAVTGTDGKTTSSSMIYHILKSAGKKVALISTVAAYIGSEEIDTGFHVTSPEEFALQKLLKRIKEEGYEFVVVESTSHGIYQHRLFGISPEISLLTNVTHEHLDYHKTYDAYLRVKVSLLARSKIAVVNEDDQSYEQVRSILMKNQVEVLTYNMQTLPNPVLTVASKRFPEQYNILNCSGVYVVLSQLGISDETIQHAIQTFPSIPGRMQEIPNKKGIHVVVDFAHTPNALKQALLSLSAQKGKGKLIAVFGAAGLRDNTKRPLMGEIASSIADEVVLTAEDPRSESVYTIMREIKAGAKTRIGHIHEIADRRKAIEFAIGTLAHSGDTVGIFGKGHEKSMNLDGKREISWSDQQVVTDILSKEGSHI